MIPSHLRGAALVALAALAALWRPVELFLLAFIVLGPLHYLTELAWLRRRSFFVRSAAGARLLAAVGATGALLAGLLEGGVVRSASLQVAAVGALQVALCLAASLVLVQRPSARLLAAVVAGGALLAGWLGSSAWARVWFSLLGVLLPTLIHVAGFTLLFMLTGWLRRRGPGDGPTLAAFLLVLPALWLAPLEIAASERAAQAYARSFSFLDRELAWWIGAGHEVAFTRLIAFLYLHHFLNWFEKTGRIGVLELPRAELAAVGLLSLSCVAVYAWDLETGLLVVLLPNVLHVVLELPLDLRAAGEIVGLRASAR